MSTCHITSTSRWASARANQLGLLAQTHFWLPVIRGGDEQVSVLVKEAIRRARLGLVRSGALDAFVLMLRCLVTVVEPTGGKS